MPVTWSKLASRMLSFVVTFGVVLGVLEALFVAGVLGTAAAAALAGMRVERISFGFGRPLLVRGRWQLCWVPLGGFTRIAGLHATENPVPADDRAAFFARPLPLRLLVTLGWPIGAELFLFAFLAAARLLGGEPVPAGVRILNVAVHGAAEAAGLHVGDVVVAIDGTPVAAAADVREPIRVAAGRPLAFEVLRDGEKLALTVTPRDVEGRGLVGVSLAPAMRLVRPSLAQAVSHGVTRVLQDQKDTVVALGQILSGPEEAELMGPVGVADVTRRMEGPERVEVLVLYGGLFVLLSLLPLPPLAGARFIGTVFGWRSRRRRNATGARDAGTVQQPKPRFPPALLAALVPIAVLVAGNALVSLEEPRFWPVVAILLVVGAALALGRPRAWAWGVCVWIAGLSSHPWLAVFALASYLVIPAVLFLPAVRRYFGKQCPVCGRLAARPVLSSPRACCLACGSTWLPAL